MNLADAIRRAAFDMSELETKAKATPAEPELEFSQPMTTPPKPEPVAPVDPVTFEPPRPPVILPSAEENMAVSGNVARIEIFMSPEQMSGMLKAIMLGQHSVMTAREAANYLRISQATLEKLAADGNIPAVQIDGKYRFPKAHLDEWIAEQVLTQTDEEVA